MDRYFKMIKPIESPTATFLPAGVIGRLRTNQSPPFRDFKTLEIIIDNPDNKFTKSRNTSINVSNGFEIYLSEDDLANYAEEITNLELIKLLELYNNTRTPGAFKC